MITANPLKRIMAERDITIKLLSMISNISEANINNILNGSSITSSNINALCKALDCQPKDLISYENECKFCKSLSNTVLINNSEIKINFCPICGRCL